MPDLIRQFVLISLAPSLVVILFGLSVELKACIKNYRKEKRQRTLSQCFRSCLTHTLTHTGVCNESQQVQSYFHSS